MPLIGLGCSSGVRRAHVESALREGYRLLDTAQTQRWNYFEAEVGEAMAASGVPREDIFLQTKIDPENLGYEPTVKSFRESLERLNTTYVDSLLLHKPRCWEGACRKWPQGTWQDSWRALEALHKEGLARHIGMCDVDAALLDEMLGFEIRPHLVQNWMDPFHQDTALRERCRRHGVQYQGYSTLGPQWVHFRGHTSNPVLAHPTLKRIAVAHSRPLAEVVLNWAVSHSTAVIPASRDPSRRAGNLRSADFALSRGELAEIDALDGELDGDGARSRLLVEFQNRGPTALSMFFVGDGGAETQLGDIAPSGAKSLRTYAGHRFVFRRGSTVAQEHVVAVGDDGAPILVGDRRAGAGAAEL